MRFANPEYLLLLLALGAYLWWKRGRSFFRSTLKYSGLQSLKVLEDRRTKILAKSVDIARVCVLLLLVIALARPQGVNVEKEILTQGIDIMLAIDVSGSMKAEDFKPENRLVVAKKTVREFIARRDTDRIGLVVFGGDAFTQCPLTLDYGILEGFVEKVELDIAGDGTAIGMAIATAVNRLKNSKSKTKIIVLLTDGVNNIGQIEPLSAASLAKTLGIKIYTIGVGKKGGAPIPYQDPVRGKRYIRNPDGSKYLTKIDEDTLRRIALETKGEYFRAVDEGSLKKIYEVIDELEKTKVKTKLFYNYEEYFPKLVWLVFILLGFEVIVSNLFLVLAP